MTRSERIRLLEEMEGMDASLDRTRLETAPGKHLRARRAAKEDVTVAFPKDALDAGATKSSSSRILCTSARSAAEFAVFSKAVEFECALCTKLKSLAFAAFREAVEIRRAALRITDKPAAQSVDLPALGGLASSPRHQQYGRISPKRRALQTLRRETSQSDDKFDIEQATSWLNDLERAVAEDTSKDVKKEKFVCQTPLYVKLSGQFRIRAYILRPHDALRAAILLAKTATLLESYQRALATTKHAAETLKINIDHEDALTSVRSATEAILAAVAARITAAEAPYMTEALLAMAESHAGRQEYLDAILGHMLWLLAANPPAPRITPMSSR